MQGSNGLQPPLNAIKIEAPSYYCNSYTPPAPDHSAMLQQAGAYSTYYRSTPIIKPVRVLFSLHAMSVNLKIFLSLFTTC